MVIDANFQTTALRPEDGEIYAHIFENPDVGISRAMFWSFTINFKPVLYAGENRACTMACEWVPWTIRDWHELDKKQLDVAYGEKGIESTFYMIKHDIGKYTRLRVDHRVDNTFKVSMEMTVDFTGYTEGHKEPEIKIIGVAEIPFTGVLVVPDNLVPKPESVDDVKQIASPFVDLTCYNEPQLQGHSYVLRPKY